MKDGDGAEVLFALAVVIYGLALLILVDTLVAIAWFLISAVIAYFRRRYLLKKADERFSEVIFDEGLDIPVDDVLQAMSIGGVEPPEGGGWDEFDLFSGTPLGVGKS